MKEMFSSLGKIRNSEWVGFVWICARVLGLFERFFCERNVIILCKR